MPMKVKSFKIDSDLEERMIGAIANMPPDERVTHGQFIRMAIEESIQRQKRLEELNNQK